jgi:hypothetical protein
VRINRFRFREISFGRLAEAVIRRAKDLPRAIEWQLGSTEVKVNRIRIEAFLNRHEGDTCFLIANGPSLKLMDLKPLRGEVTIGLNRIYLFEEHLGFLPTYYVCINELVLEQFFNEISELQMPKFINWNRKYLFDPETKNLHYLRIKLGLNDTFQNDIHKPMTSGGTVTYAALQIAYFMGFNRVVIIGLDHSYEEKGVPNKTVVRHQKTDIDHFHPDYFPEGSKWQPPDLSRSEIAFSKAKEAYRRNGREILDATVGGKLDIFPKVNFYDLFEA